MQGEPRGAWLRGVLVFTGLLLAAGSLPGESVFRGETARIRGFDPALTGDMASIQAMSRIYEGLYQYAYLDRPYGVIPALAESMPVHSDDGRTLTIRLRKGVRFQDDPCFPGGRGREVCAQDWVYSILRIADPRTQSTGFWAFRGRIAGLDEYRNRGGTGEVAGLKALDRYTIRIGLNHPDPQFLWILCLHYAYVVPREAVVHYGEAFVRHPVGTGPYRMVSWNPNYRVEFVRNPQWGDTRRDDVYPGTGAPGDKAAGLLTDAGAALPLIDRVVQHVISDPSTQWLMFLRGELDISGVSRDNWDAVVAPDGSLSPGLAQQGIVLDSVPGLVTEYLGFNADDPVVGRNRALRQALTCALDTDAWIEFYRRQIVRARGPVPPGIEGSWEDPPRYPFDLERARRLLAEAGYPGGVDPKTGRRLELTLDIGSTDVESRESSELLAHFFDRIGVVIRPQFNNRPTFFSRIERRQVQLFRLNWVADYPDAENFFQLFYGPNASPGANRANYANPEYDRLYEAARGLPDGPARREVYGRMNMILAEDCPWIFLHHPVNVTLRHDWVLNFKPHDFPYGMAKYWRVDDARRAQRTGGAVNN